MNRILTASQRLAIARECSVKEVRHGPFIESCVPTPWGNMFSRISKESDAAHPDIHAVLIHGMIISGNYMIPLARRLLHDFRVHVIDFPGYGRSDKPEKILTIPEMADALATWMEVIGVKRSTLIANSFGCQVAAEFGSRYPQFVDRLVLQGPTVDPHARSLLTQIIRLKLNSWRESKRVGMISARDYKKAGLRRVLKTISMTMNDRIEEKLPLLQMPTLIVRGDRDLVCPQAWAEEATRLLPRGELRIVPGGAHTLNYSEPDKFAEVIRTFLGV